jgi:hypothetical protein
MDLSLFREHEEGFPGDLFYEDTEGEVKLQQMVPQWRQAGKASEGGKGGGFSLKSKKSCKENKGKGKGSTKSPSSSDKENCSDAPAPAMAPALGVGSPPSGGGSPSGGLPTVSTGSAGDGAASFDASDANCALVAASSDLTSGGPSTSLLDLNLDVDTLLRIKSKNNIDVTALLDKYTKYVRLYVLGCFDEAVTELNSIVQRRLMTEPLFQATMDDWSGKCLPLGCLLSV